MMVSAGDLISLPQLHHLAEQNPNGNIHIFYGSTEVLRTCHRQWKPSDLEGCIGMPLPSVQLHPSQDGLEQFVVQLCLKRCGKEKCVLVT